MRAAISELPRKVPIVPGVGACKMAPLRPVCVEWHDIFDDGAEWIHHDAKPAKPVKVRTTGYLLEKNKKFVVLVRDYYDHDGKRTFGGRVAIPVGAIEKIIPLAPKPTKQS